MKAALYWASPTVSSLALGTAMAAVWIHAWRWLRERAVRKATEREFYRIMEAEFGYLPSRLKDLPR